MMNNRDQSQIFEDAEQLRNALKDILVTRFDEETAIVLAYVIVKYPYCRPEKLPETLVHDLEQSAYDLDVQEIRSRLKMVDTETDFFADRGETNRTGLSNRLEPGADDEFVSRLRQQFRAVPEVDSDLDTVLNELEQYHDQYLLRRVDSRVERIPIATNARATETFKTDLDFTKYERVDELCLIAFSFETLPEFVRQAVRQWIKNGITVKILLYSERLGEEMENARVKTAIDLGSKELNQLQSETKDYSGELKYRFIVRPEHTYFRGLLVRSIREENTYRMLVLDNERERGVNATVLRGRGSTTIYGVLDKYFEEVWRAARPPGIQGLIQRNREPIGLVLAVVVFGLGIFSWVTGLFSQRVSEVAISITIGIIITLVERMYRNVFM